MMFLENRLLEGRNPYNTNKTSKLKLVLHKEMLWGKN